MSKEHTTKSTVQLVGLKLPELIRVIEEVRTTRRSRVLLRDSEEVAVIAPPQPKQTTHQPVRIDPSGDVIAQTAGIFKGRGPALSAQELREQAEIAFAEEALERMGK